MHLLRRIAISNGDNRRKEEATAALSAQNRETIMRWNKELEDEIWQKIFSQMIAGNLSTIKEESEAE